MMRSNEFRLDHGLFYCSTELEEKSIQESWYYLTQAISHESTPLLDMRRLANRSWTKVIRGKNQFENFKTAMQTKGAYFALTPILNDSQSGIEATVGAASNDLPLFSDANFPGLIGSL